MFEQRLSNQHVLFFSTTTMMQEKTSLAAGQIAGKRGFMASARVGNPMLTDFIFVLSFHFGLDCEH